ncbi:GDP dissociation inhibitor family protein [Trichinella spiralis]|uniref:GDP dissociation inhibitor family protein n=1 Tax=Trichinella spiralis TaxID=6334 RepID=UPI0001EFBE63|nr:GDP dissociation inhibitor family protein [Trichinella spiralis]
MIFWYTAITNCNVIKIIASNIGGLSSDVYGGNLATLDLDHLIKWLHNGGILWNSEEIQAPDLSRFINEDECLFPIGDRQQIGKTIFNVKYEWHIPDKEEKVIEGVEVKNTDEIAKPIDRDYLKENNHRFSIDTNPRVVQLKIENIINSENGQLTEVFASREIEKMDKRLLMQFLSFCFQYEKFPEQWLEFENRPALEFMEHKKLPPLVQHHLLQALALGTSQTTTKQFLQRLHRFIQGVGRFGTSPYLWTIHGSGELPQAFCRCAAVNGAVYCLRRPVRAWIFNKQRSALHIVSMLAFCTEANENPILLFDSASGVCASPKGTNSDADNMEKPRLIFSAYFTQKVAKTDVDLAKRKLFENVIVTSLPSYNVDLDDVVDEHISWAKCNGVFLKTR